MLPYACSPSGWLGGCLDGVLRAVVPSDAPIPTGGGECGVSVVEAAGEALDPPIAAEEAP
eukprot:COSAG01_NODE_1177_length_11372_cov_4.507851_7_plen_60_part_00